MADFGPIGLKARGREAVRCDRCGNVGFRNVNFICPALWWYIATEVEGTFDVLYTFACSSACEQALWRPGPGPKLPEPVVFSPAPASHCLHGMSGPNADENCQRERVDNEEWGDGKAAPACSIHSKPTTAE